MRSIAHSLLLFSLLSLFSFGLSAGPPNTEPLIRVDQFGYLPDMQKIAVISNPQNGYNNAESFSPSATLEVRRWDDDVSVFSGAVVAWDNGATHPQSGDQVWWFDFSAVNMPGDYYVYDPSQQVGSYRFRIEEGVYKTVLVQAMRTFFYQRSGFAKQAPYVPSAWADGASHLHAEQDLDCRLVTDPTNTALSKDLSGGWYDAGDYNKYVSFTHSVVHNLLSAYEQNSVIWTDDFNLPESGNGIPDLLDEIQWELDWLMKMQLADGSCLTKVSVTDFAAASPPSADMAPRRYGPAQASATRTVASLFAHAAIVYRSVNTPATQTYADSLESRALRAWNWLTNNPGYSYYDNNGFQSASPQRSEYDQDATQVCAAAYLYALTDDVQFRNYFDANYADVHALQWTFWYAFETPYQDALLYYASLPNATGSVVSAIHSNAISSVNNNHAGLLTAFQANEDPYRAYLSDQDYTWGSNQTKAHTGLLFSNMIHFNISTANHTDYRNAAAGYIHYLHGINPNGIAYLTHMEDFGAERSADEMYHSWFSHGTDFDNAQTSPYGPAPGYVTGGPNPGFTPAQGYFSPPQDQPIQKSYKDWNTSWPENSWEITEPAIYYQAAYVKLLAQFTRNESVTMGVDIQNEIDVHLFPNPTHNQLFIQWEKPSSQLDLSIYTLQGQLVRKEIVRGGQATELALGDLAQGQYLLVLRTDERMGTKRFEKR